MCWGCMHHITTELLSSIFALLAVTDGDIGDTDPSIVILFNADASLDAIMRAGNIKVR